MSNGPHVLEPRHLGVRLTRRYGTPGELDSASALFNSFCICISRLSLFCFVLFRSLLSLVTLPQVHSSCHSFIIWEWSLYHSDPLFFSGAASSYCCWCHPFHAILCSVSLSPTWHTHPIHMPADCHEWGPLWAINNNKHFLCPSISLHFTFLPIIHFGLTFLLLPIIVIWIGEIRYICIPSGLKNVSRTNLKESFKKIFYIFIFFSIGKCPHLFFSFFYWLMPVLFHFKEDAQSLHKFHLLVKIL